MVKSILFVCLGNICRSPLAEGIAREIAQKGGLEVKLDSAGTSGWHIGEHPDERSIEVAQKHGIDISKLKGRKVNPYADDSFDLIVAMDRQNYKDLQTLGFSKEKLVLMGDFGLQGREIPDPYHMGLDGFEKVYEMLETAMENLFSALQRDS